MPIEPAVVIPIIVVIVVVVGIIAWRMEKKRREELRRWAREDGWSLDEGKRGNPGHPFPLFDNGHSRYSRFHARKVSSDNSLVAIAL